MKKASVAMIAFAVLLGFSAASNAAPLQVIGTASYGGADYNLIYQEDGPFGSITWLDYRRGYHNWQNQVNWASGLGSDLTVTLDPGYTSTIDWSTGWRLPETADGPYGTTTVGYNITTSEMGYLFYEALGNKGYEDTSGNGPQPGYGLQNKGDFENLLAFYYWSGTEYPPDSSFEAHAWDFDFHLGLQRLDGKFHNLCALAVRPGDVSAVPVPGTVLLLASGLAGLGALGRGRRRRRR